MKIILKKVFKNVKRLNNEGFTLLEMLFSFFVFSIIVSFLPLLLSIILDNASIEERIQRMEWEVFVSQLKREAQMSEDTEVVNGEIVFSNSGDKITYEKYGRQLRRLVNRKGHEVVLQNVASVQFEKRQNKIVIEVEDIYDNTHVSALFPFIPRSTVNE